MYLNNINFPNQILDAIQDNKLVVFAGAGASLAKPTSLPNFKKLAEEIAEGTGQTIKKEEPCEVFLGALKAEGIDVNGIAAQILSGVCLKHNALHEAIVDLFPSLDRVKIVTTNYDQMLEQVFEERAAKVPVFNSPALPLGNDITGIIHIHGNVCDSKYMVVTDEDFGMAYLTEGYAARFLVRLFESYTVLFIGYSYNDTILRYLTRAMSRKHSVNRYILTDDTEANWQSLGISAIFFPKRSFAVMRGGLVKLGNLAKKGLLDWRNQFVTIADAPPKDVMIETEIDYCLENTERSRVLSKYIRGGEWLELLVRKGVLSACFSDSKPLDEKTIIWGNWLLETFIGKDDEHLINLLAKHGNRLNSNFAELLLRKIIQSKNDVSNEYFSEYITLLDRYLIDPWIIQSLIEIAYTQHLYHLSLHLFEKLFSISIRLEKSWIQDKRLEPRHLMTGDYHAAKRTWALINKEIVRRYALEVLSFVQMTIEEVHYQYVEMKHATDNQEPWSMAMLDIEDHEKEYSKEPLHVLVEAFLQAVKALGKNEDSRFCLHRGLNSKSILLRKIALRAIRETAYFNDDEKIDLICNNTLVWFVEGKEQVFLLARETFAKASNEKQNQLLDIIEQGPSDCEENYRKRHATYDWCDWLKRINSRNRRIDSILEQILSEYSFAPSEHPERNIIESDAVSLADMSPLSIPEMLEMPIEELATMMLEFKNDTFEGPTRLGLLKTFSDCIKGNSEWAKGIMDYFYTHETPNMEIWNCLFWGLGEAELSVKEIISWCKRFIVFVDVMPDVHGVAHYLWKVLQNNEKLQRIKEHEQVVFELTVKLWNRRSTTKPVQSRLIDITLNTTTGLVLMCWINMVSYSETAGIPDLYKTKFEEALKLDSWEREVAICILAGHFNFFCNRDRLWCTARFELLLTGEQKNEFICAWEGVVYYSVRISKDMADVVAPIYLKAVQNITWLEGEVRNRFIELYLSLLILVVEKPNYKYIPEFYNSSSEEIRVQFVRTISRRLRNLDLDTKLHWWNSWLMRFLENRKNNKPVGLTEAECSSLFMLIPSLDFVFDDAVKILCKGSRPYNLDHLFWYELNKKESIVAHSHSIVKLLIALLNSLKDLNYADDYIIQIVNALQGLEEKEQKQLREALLKHGIDVSLN